MRRVILIVLSVCACATAILSVWSTRSRIVFFDDSAWEAPTALQINRGAFSLRYPETVTVPPKEDRTFELPGLSFQAVERQMIPRMRGAGTVMSLTTVRAVSWTLKLWVPLLGFAAYPSLTLVLTPILYASRRSRRCCHRCGYSLVGNQIGVCSECGINADVWQVPLWQRVVISLLFAIIVGWLFEFVNETYVIDHRVAMWILRQTGNDVGSWMVMSTLRSVLFAGICLLIYTYLSPDRYDK